MMILTAILLLGSVSVVLPAEANVTGTELRLDAVAQIAGDDPAEVESISALHLGYAPAPGYSRLLDAQRLLHDIQAAAPDVDVRLSGARACRVWPRTTSISAAAIEAVAREELARHLENTDATATLIAKPADIRVPAGAQQSELRSLVAASAVRPGTVSVPVRLMVDGNVYRTVWTSWRVDIWATQSVLVRDVHAGERLTAEMFESRRLALPLGTARGRVLGQALLVGSAAARNLSAGNVVTERDVVRPVLVKSGDTIFFEVKKGAITARVPAVAEADGARGDRIPVTLVDSNREIKGIVASRDLVRIDLGSPR